MENILDHIDELIGKYLAGEASEAEVAALETWIAAHQDNRHYFNQFKTIFQKAANVKVLQQFDTDAAWNKVRSKLDQSRGAKTVSIATPFPRLFLRIAASIIFFAGIGYAAYFLLSPSTPTTNIIAVDNVLSDTLPDGSAVFLNRKTQLSYNTGPRQGSRIVELSGEAHFKIRHHDDLAFIVEADNIFIKDIGTSFNVNAYPDSTDIRVTVEEGEVVFYTESNPGIRLRKGETGIYHKTTKTFSRESARPNVTAYKTRHFIFNNNDLSTIVRTLNSVYDKKISIGKNLVNCRLTVSFNDEDPDEIANIIAETLTLTIKDSDGTIVLEGKGCEE